MPFSFVFYPDPLDARATLTPDGQPPIVAVPYTHTDGRAGQVAYVPDTTPSAHGAELRLEAAGYLPSRVRGFLLVEPSTHVARLQVDDFMLTAEPAPPEPTPPPSGNESPEQIIQRVYSTTHPNLATHDGCGRFTEDCCTALHNDHADAWGHIDKDPGQNQYNGHAVDALMLLYPAKGTQPGIYDIIFSSVSAEAKPAFNYVEPPRYEDWVYPAGAATRGAVIVSFQYPRRIAR